MIQRDSTLASYVVMSRVRVSVSLYKSWFCQDQQKWVIKRNLRGSVAEVCEHVHLWRRGSKRCSTEHYTKNRPGTHNDSFLRHWRVYSNDGLDKMHVAMVKAFWHKVNHRVVRLLWVWQKSHILVFYHRLPGGGLWGATDITFGTFTCLTIDKRKGITTI